MRGEEAQIERPLTGNKRREKAQTKSEGFGEQETFEEPKKAEFAAVKAVEEAAYAAKTKEMEEVELLPPAPA